MSSPRASALILVVAAALTLALSVLPFGGVLTYPFRIFVTYVHESSHVIATLLTGGRALGMNVDPDGSGVAYHRGGVGIIVSSAGYLGSTLFGGFLLLLCGRQAVARRTLVWLGVATFAVTLLFVGFSPFPAVLTLGLAGIAAVLGSLPARSSGLRTALAVAAGAVAVLLIAVVVVQKIAFPWLAGLLLATGLLLAGQYLSPGAAHFLLGFLAVQCCMSAVLDLLTLVTLSAGTNVQTDARNMQAMTGIPAIVWALLWTAVAVVVLVLTLGHFVKRAAAGDLGVGA
jgi:hypothetical protein